jgi:response regulator RpfG family c-di-GMP phosphodiesterase
MCSVLVIDDEILIRDVITRWLQALGYEPREAASADEALRIMADSPADVALCDISMPGHDGLWMAERLRALHPDTAIIMATGSQEVDAALHSLNLGAVDYLAKPFTRDQLRDSVRLGMEWHRNAVRGRQRIAALELELRERLSPLSDYLCREPVTTDDQLYDMLESLGLDSATLQHSRRVALISVNLSLALGLRGSELSDIERAALMHDIGRLAMPKTILSKPSALTEEEHAVIRLQPKLIHEIIRDCPFLEPASDTIRSAYERFDGTGYPWGLKGEEIPIGARIVAVADAFDTMTHQRMHREARALPEALFEIQRHRHTQFDPKVVDALLKVVSLHWHRGAAKTVTGEHVNNPPELSGEPQDAEIICDDEVVHYESLELVAAV